MNIEQLEINKEFYKSYKKDGDVMMAVIIDWWNDSDSNLYRLEKKYKKATTSEKRKIRKELDYMYAQQQTIENLYHEVNEAISELGV